MSYEQKRKDIQGFFATYFTALAATKIAWDNVDFEIPSDKSSWCRFSVQHNVSNFVSFGPNRRTRRQGIIFVQIFVIENSETLVASQLTDAVVNVFETKQLGGVVFESPDVREAGVSRGWFQVNISVPFYYDDITSLT